MASLETLKGLKDERSILLLVVSLEQLSRPRDRGHVWMPVEQSCSCLLMM